MRSIAIRSLACGIVLLCGVLWQMKVHAAEPPVVVAAALSDPPDADGSLQTAVLAGGCFWGVQGVFEHLSGVRRVVSGYAGGDKGTADYETVSGGRTGHAESVQITFDSRQVSFGDILRVFFSVAHDPTQLNRQGPDVGTQYRSVIFYADETQKKIAEAYVAQLSKTGFFHRPIVTHIDPLKGFFAAEEYHQDFLLKNPAHPYIVVHDLPKIRNFQRLLPALYQPQPVTVAFSEH
jgi:peptide-methionine (S)-S-oxide reductase